MASGAGSPFSLRPMPAGDRKPKNLAEFIARMNAHSDGFRNVREDDLHKEIEAQKHGAGDSTDLDSTDGSDTENDTESSVDLRAARDEILRNIEIAHRNAMLTLDFVSLLLSKETPVQAGMTLSPELREMVGIGTLGATNLSASNLTKARVQENKLVATGRKLLDINNTADSILSAASRLQKEISLETKYWAEVLAVSDSGWSVSRLPQEPQTMGVKFGFSESGAEFRANSLAPMRRADDGSVNLDTGGLGGDSKRLLVSIEKDGKVVGRSSLPEVLSEDAPLESRVLEARNSIFAQELWHEINREGRTLLSYNVRLESSAVTYGLDANTNIVFKLVTLGDEADLGGPPDSNSEDGNAETICTVLYLLLSYGHRQNGRKRSQQPLLSAAQGRQAHPPHYLLRPIVAYLNFEGLVQRCIRFLSDLTAILQSAGITTAAYTISEPPVTLRSLLPASESLLAVLLDPLSFRAELTITPEARLEIVGHTFTAQYVTGQFRVGLLPPAGIPSGQGGDAPAAGDGNTPPDNTTANPLFRAFPPGDGYPSLDEVLIYVRQAIPRVLADRYEGLAAEWTAAAAAERGGQHESPEWIVSIDGKAVRDRDTEDRGVRFELYGTAAADGDDDGDDGIYGDDGSDGGGGDPSRLRELRVTGDLFADGKPVRRSWAWTAAREEVEEAPGGRLDDVVRQVLLCP